MRGKQMTAATLAVDDGTWRTESEISDRERYVRYLASPEWSTLRSLVKARSGCMCERCHLNRSEAVHHLTYERIFCELLDDVQDVCRTCHDFIHGLSFQDPLMPIDPDNLKVGCSGHSIFKQQVFRAFMIEHCSICRAISESKKWKEWEYLYIDMHGGPGYLPIDPSIPGSPVIAVSVCEGVVPFRAVVFEANRETFDSLCEKGYGFTAILGQSERLITKLAEKLPPIRRCGLVYADPNKLHPADTSVLDALESFSRVPSAFYLDILMHIPATTYKRVRCVSKHCDSLTLSDALKRINKRSIKVSRPDTAQQWAFILMTNSPQPQFGRRMGWYDIDSDRGRLILDRLSMTEQEREHRRPANFLFDVE